MVESSWPTSEVTQEHLKNLACPGYMTEVELATCHVAEDPTSSTWVGGYIMACMMFFEQGFCLPSHHFSTPCCGPS
jgi:hypothetical protein